MTDKHCSSQLSKFPAFVTTIIPCTNHQRLHLARHICVQVGQQCNLEVRAWCLKGGMLTNCHTPGFKLGLCMRLQIAAEALCGLLHHNLIHTVEPKAHQATQPCCACRTARYLGPRAAAAFAGTCLAPTKRKSFAHTVLKSFVMFCIHGLLCLTTSAWALVQCKPLFASFLEGGRQGMNACAVVSREPDGGFRMPK